VIKKGISSTDWAITWLLVAVAAGWLHLNLGYILNFVEEWTVHSAKAAIVEVGSWLLMLNGLWIFIFSDLFSGAKPTFLVGSEALFATGPLGFGFEGFPAIMGIVGLVLFGLGIAILLSGPWYEVVEFLVPLAHVLSYTRLTAVLLAKAGMALAVNLLYFGAYRDEEGFHFMHKYATNYEPHHGEVVFGGIANMGGTEIGLGPAQLALEGALLGLPVYIVGHIVVLAIGGTAAIQAVRLEYFEFFEKFYEGGGKKYEPFGHERTHTSDN
jgi:V/A-type H+-transporting ATPase subunit I